MEEQDRAEAPRERESVTVVETGGRRSGGGLTVLAVVLLLVVAGLVFLLFGGGGVDRAAERVGVNVSVDAPQVKLPDVKVALPDDRHPGSEPGAGREPARR